MAWREAHTDLDTSDSDHLSGCHKRPCVPRVTRGHLPPRGRRRVKAVVGDEHGRVDRSWHDTPRASDERGGVSVGRAF